MTLTFLALLALVQGVPDSVLPRDPAITTGRLANGLHYYVRVNRRPEKRMELRLAVNAGSILEDPDQRGMAHFVEHMAFNGTRRFRKQELVDYIEKIGMRFGADLNASTSFDETIYQLQVPTDSAHIMRRAFDILEDWAHGVTFDTTEIRKERGVVLEEWRLGRGAGQRMFDQQLPVIFRGSRYADRLPIGTPECIRTCTPTAIRRFYADWYRPDLMAVVAVGDFDPAAVVALIREHFGRIPARVTPRPRSATPVPPHAAPEVSIATDPEATSTSITVFVQRPASPQGTVGAYRARLIEAMAAGILNQRLDELTQRADPPFINAGAGQTELVRGAEAFSFAALVGDSGVARGLRAVLTELERVGQHGYTQPELNRIRADFLRGWEQTYAERDKSESGGFAEEYVRNFLTNEPIPGIAHEFERVRTMLPTVTVAELDAVAKGWLGAGAPVILVQAPEKNRPLLPSAEGLLDVFQQVKRADIAAYTETVSEDALVPRELAPAAITGERRDTVLGTTEWTLANGVHVVLKPTDFQADELLFSGSAPGGVSLAPDSLVLSAQLAAQLVAVSGVGAFSAVDLQKKLAGKAAGLSAFIGSNEQGVSGRASPRDAETLFQLAYLHFTAPRLDSTAVGAFMGNIRAALANRSASPQVAFSDTLSVTLAQHHPRARPISAARLAELDPRAALDFYRARFADASGFTFFLVGNFTPDSVRPLVQRYLGNLPAAGSKETARDTGIRPPDGVVERTVRKGIEPKSQTALVFTGPTTATREERVALDALASILEIRLREELREELGGTYGVSVSGSASRIPRPRYTVAINYGSAPERVDTLMRAVWAEIDSLKARGPRAVDLAKYKETEIRSRETDLRQNGWWLQLLSGARAENEDPAGRFALAPMLERLTPAVVQAAARTYLDPARYVRVTLLPEGRTP